MEDTLREGIDYVKIVRIPGLNPCFNGRYSQRQGIDYVKIVRIVLILVLMEDTLRDK